MICSINIHLLRHKFSNWHVISSPSRRTKVFLKCSVCCRFHPLSLSLEETQRLEGPLGDGSRPDHRAVLVSVLQSQALSHLSHLTSERKACPYLISCHSSERHDAQPQLTSDIKMFSHGAPAVRWQQLAFFFIKLIDSLAFYHLLSLFIICSLLAT